MLLELLASIAFSYSPAIPPKSSNYELPGISRSMKVNSKKPPELADLVLAGQQPIEDYSGYIKDLDRDLAGTFKLPFYFPKDEGVCYRFFTSMDGRLIAAFVYNININPLTYKEEPSNLSTVIYLPENQNAAIIDYNDAISSNPNFWDKFWRNVHNVKDVTLDDKGLVEQRVNGLFGDYMQQKFKPSKNGRVPRLDIGPDSFL